MIANPDAHVRCFSYHDGQIVPVEKPVGIENGQGGIRADQILLAVVPYYEDGTVARGVDSLEVGQSGEIYQAANLMLLVIDR